jgi:hypothetical protein
MEIPAPILGGNGLWAGSRATASQGGPFQGDREGRPYHDTSSLRHECCVSWRFRLPFWVEAGSHGLLFFPHHYCIMEENISRRKGGKHMSATPANPKVEAIRLSVQKSYAELNQLIDGPLARLDMSKLYEVPAENEWTIMQNLAHVVELMPYWAGEIEKLLAALGENFGRLQQDEGRLRAISEHGTDSLEQVKGALPGSYARLEEVLGKLKDSDLELTGRHVRFGEKSLEWIIKEFVTDHLRGHVEQIKGCLEVVG